MKLLKLTNVQKNFLKPIETHVLKRINLQIEQNKTYAIMGASGEGKSTLLNILGTLDKPSKGTLKFSQNLDLYALRNQFIGFIFQSYYLIENITTLENILIPVKIARKSTKKGSLHYKRAYDLLEKVGLEHRANYQAALLSGGEKQRTCIARALINDPQLILADEPTGNLDQTTSNLIQNLLLNCIKSTNKSLIVVTHDKDFAALLDEIFILENGILRKKTLI